MLIFLSCPIVVTNGKFCLNTSVFSVAFLMADIVVFFLFFFSFFLRESEVVPFGLESWIFYPFFSLLIYLLNFWCWTCDSGFLTLFYPFEFVNLTSLLTIVGTLRFIYLLRVCIYLTSKPESNTRSIFKWNIVSFNSLILLDWLS